MKIELKNIFKLFVIGVVVILLIGIGVFLFKFIKINTSTIIDEKVSIVEINDSINDSIVKTIFVYPMKLNFNKSIRSTSIIKFKLGELNISSFIDAIFSINDYYANETNNIIYITLNGISYDGYNLKDTIIKEDTIVKTNISSSELDNTILEIKKDIDKYLTDDFLLERKQMIKNELLLQLQNNLKKLKLENRIKISWQKEN
jgi:hypothetical protein